jgi:phospholipase C
MFQRLPALHAIAAAACLLMSPLAFADGNLSKVNHIIIVMQENHSFDNYFGALAYAPGSPYHNGNGTCASTDHKCVDGLTCTLSGSTLNCTNSNLDDNGSIVHAFKAASRCVGPDLDHSWVGTHHEMNFANPNSTLQNPVSNGFVRQNDLTEQHDSGESSTDDQTISFYNQNDLPFYYGLAQHFAISDRQFASVLGPTFPNRSYLMAATSFGHLTTNDTVPPVVGYQPITGTIFDQLDRYGVSWADYFEDVPQDGSFRPFDSSHNQPLANFYLQAAGIGALPQVLFVDPNFGTTGHTLENDEHPPTDIQRGQYHVSNVINAVRNGPHWKDSIIFVLYDEHGGFYDHARPPRAPQNGTRTPDGIYPGQCEDLSFPPFSEQPGQGAECSWNFVSTTDTSVRDAEALCPALANNPTGPYPTSCAAFDQLGVRVPLIAVSPFSKPAYVSHTIGDHTSLLAMIEKRFLSSVHLTRRDQYANDLEGMFDFDHSPSLNTAVGSAQSPQNDCTPLP